MFTSTNKEPDVELALGVIRNHLNMLDINQVERLDDLRVHITIGGYTKQIYERKLKGRVEKFIVILSNQEITKYLDPRLGIFISMFIVDLPGALTLISRDQWKQFIVNKILIDYNVNVKLDDVIFATIDKKPVVSINTSGIKGVGSLCLAMTYAYRDEVNRIKKFMCHAIARDRQLKDGDLINVWTEKELKAFYKSNQRQQSWEI